MSRYVLAAAALALAAPALCAPPGPVTPNARAAAPVPPEGGKAVSFPYPAKAPIVVCLNGYDKARDRLNALLKAALPDDAAKITKLIDGELDKLLEGRKLTAIRKDARAFLVLNDLSGLFDDTPPVSVLIPVTGYQDFKESFLTKEELKTLDRGRDGVDAIKTAAFGEEMAVFLVDLKEYVALTIDKPTAEIYAGKYTPGTVDAMGSDLAESFLKADLAAYVNMDAINDQFGDQIRGFKGLIDFGLQQAQQQGMLPGFNKRQMEALKVILKGMFQGVEDCRAVVLAAEFKPEGLALRLQARFAENSASAKLLAQERPIAMAEVAKLPTGLGIYGGTRFGRTITESIRDISQEFSTTEDDERGAMLIEQHLKDLAAAGHEGDFTATAAPGTAITVSNYKDPAKAARALTKTYKAIAAGGKVNSVIVKAAPRVSDEAATHRGFTFTEVVVKYDFDATVAGFPEPAKDAMLQSLKRTMSEKTTMWIGTDGKVVVQLMAEDWGAAKGLLDKYLDAKPSVGADAGFKLTRSQLPAETNLLLIAETGAALASLTDSLRSVGDAVPGLPKIGPLKPVKGDPTYVGLAVTLKGDTASVTAFIPTGAITVARKMLGPLFKNIE
jgi:hypothetical protein